MNCSVPDRCLEQVSETSGKLHGRALVGVGNAQQQLRDPEISRTGALLSFRRLTWPLVCGEASYEVCYTLAKGVARLSLNGFPVAEKSLGMFAQVRLAANVAQVQRCAQGSVLQRAGAYRSDSIFAWCSIEVLSCVSR